MECRQLNQFYIQILMKPSGLFLYKMQLVNMSKLIGVGKKRIIGKGKQKPKPNDIQKEFMERQEAIQREEIESRERVQREANDLQMKSQMEVFQKNMRSTCLSYALSYYSNVLGGMGDERGDLIIQPQEVLETAKKFENWINEPLESE